MGEVNATRCHKLTPKAKGFYKTLKGIKMLTMAKHVNPERFRIAKQLENSEDFQNILQHIDKPTYNFIRCQVTNHHLVSRARLYIVEEKFLALTLFKSTG